MHLLIKYLFIMSNILWVLNIKKLKNAIFIYTGFSLLATLFSGINSIVNPVNIKEIVDAVMSGEASALVEPSLLSILSTVCSVLVIVGYVLFFISISNFVKMQHDEADTRAASDVRLAYILFAIGVVSALIPVIGSIAWLVLVIVGFVKLYKGYSGLSHSAVLGARAKEGADLLRKVVTWMIVGIVVSWFPLIGYFLSFAIGILVLVNSLKGWTMIAEGAPADDYEITSAE